MNPIFGGVIEAAIKVIDKVIPDPQRKAEMQLEVLKLNQAGAFKELEAEVQLALGQLEVNKVEAAAPDLFRGGWRPAVGWTCAGGLFYQLLGRPVLGWMATNLWGWSMPPELELDTLLTLLFGMLGLGAYRTIERVRGKA